MAIPTLENLTLGLDAACMARLGDTILYRAEGQGGYATIRAYVEHTEALRDLSTGQAIEQDITVEVLKTDAPVKPGGLCRVQLPKIAGATFKAANVRQDAGATHWRFELVRVNA